MPTRYPSPPTRPPYAEPASTREVGGAAGRATATVPYRGPDGAARARRRGGCPARRAAAVRPVRAVVAGGGRDGRRGPGPLRRNGRGAAAAVRRASRAARRRGHVPGPARRRPTRRARAGGGG